MRGRAVSHGPLGLGPLDHASTQPDDLVTDVTHVAGTGRSWAGGALIRVASRTIGPEASHPHAHRLGLLASGPAST
jgi:hypothetical protein